MRQYETQTGTTISEEIKAGSVTRNTTDGPLAKLLIFNAHRLTSWQKMKDEVVQIRNAQAAAAMSTEYGRGYVAEGRFQMRTG